MTSQVKTNNPASFKDPLVGQQDVAMPIGTLGNTQPPPGPPPSDTTSFVPSKPKKKTFKVIFGLVIMMIFLGIGFIAIRTIGLDWLGLKKDTTIIWWGLWEDEALVQPLIEEYQQKNPGIKIDYVKNSPQDYRERLTNSLAKGNGPDIFRFHNSWTPMFKNELDSVPASVANAAQYAQDYHRVILSDMTSGTGIVGVPLGYDAITLYINEEIFEKENVVAPKTWDELRQTAKQLTKRENEMITQAGVALGRTENVDHWQEILALMMIQNGANLNRPSGSLAEGAVTFYTLFSGADGVWDETLPSSTIAFASGKLAMYFAPSWRAFEIQHQNPNLRFRTVPLPQLPKDNPTQPDYAYASYWVEGVWSRSPNKVAAWDFLKFVSEKTSLEKLYQNASSVRGFGEAYPRTDMADSLKDHPVLGSIIVMAPDAQSWYLASRTHDGPTGINSQINKYFEDAVNSVNSGDRVVDAMLTASQGVRQVLAQYGLVRPDELMQNTP